MLLIVCFYEQSTRFIWSIYHASWIGKSQKMKNDIFIMLQRSQQPLLIFMGGLLPALTLEYYANVRNFSFQKKLNMNH